MPGDVLEVEGLEVAHAGVVEEDQEGHHLGVGHLGPALPLGHPGTGEAVLLEETVVGAGELVGVVEDFYYICIGHRSGSFCVIYLIISSKDTQILPLLCHYRELFPPGR